MSVGNTQGTGSKQAKEKSGMRTEFPKSVRRAALARSGGYCEGEGPLYGLAEGKRCNANLVYGFHADHVNPDGNGGQPTLENCAAVCPLCHKFKTKNDVARIAKMKRQRDRNQGIKRRKGPPMMGSRDSLFKRKMDGTVERR